MKALSGSRVLSRIHQSRYWRNTNRRRNYQNRLLGGIVPLTSSGSLTTQHLSLRQMVPHSVSFPPEARITHPVLLQSSQQHRFASSRETSKAKEDEDAPVRYTSSKALDWSVHNSFGRHKKQPWYKVAPLSIALTIFIAWIFLRKETDIDRELEKHLHERLPNMFPPPAEVAEDEILLNKEDEKTSTE